MVNFVPSCFIRLALFFSCIGAGQTFTCTETGLFPDPLDCSKFYNCFLDQGSRADCPSGLYFNPELKVCDRPSNVPCRTQERKTTYKPEATGRPIGGPVPNVAPTEKPASTTGGMRRVCYYTNWSQYRNGGGKFMPSNINPRLCTHLIYAFAKLDGNRLATFEWNDEDMYKRFNALKKENPQVKTLLAVGGWNMASEPFSKMVATAQSRLEFAESTVAFLRSRDFDGLDLDWEFPAGRGSPPEDKDRFTLLVKGLRQQFTLDAANPGHTALLLTAAVSAGKSTIDGAYDIPEISKYLDFISLMSYDLHGSWETVTGHHSPLFPSSDDNGDEETFNVDWAARYWVSNGCPKEKLVIGIPFYSRTFTLASTSNTGLRAAARGPGTAGSFTREAGFLAYYEVCRLQGTKVRLVEQKVPYMIYNDQWIGYDDIESVKEKANYAKTNGYAGVMIWSLDMDDFTGGMCGLGTYPLLTAVNNALLS